MDKGILIIGGLTVLVIAGILAYVLVSPEGKPPLGQEIAIQGADHIPVGSSHPPYNSNPPTSGWHYAEPAPWGVKTEPLPDETLVHNLEHGGVWIAYHPDKVDPETLARLVQIARRHLSKVILSPRPANDSPIALASWGRLEKLERFDEAKIKAFISRNKNKGPERVPD